MYARVAAATARKASVPRLNLSSPTPRPTSPLTSPRLTRTFQQPFSTLKPVGVSAANGSQGTAYVTQLLTADTRTVAITRSGKAFDKDVLVSGVLNKVLKTSETQGLTEVQVSNTPRPDMVSFLINAATTDGMKDTIDAAPAGSKILLTQNGVDPLVGNREGKTLAYAISTIVTKPLGSGGIQVEAGGKIQVGESNPFLNDLLQAFGEQKVFSVDVVKDIDQTKWEKIALNCSLNTTATVFGITLGELSTRMDTEPRMKALVEGLAFEALQLASAIGVQVNAHSKVMDTIRAVMNKFSRHPTSMQSTFNENKKTEVSTLTGAVSKQTEDIAKRDSIVLDAPLSRLISKCINEFSEARSEFASTKAFRSQRADWIEGWHDILLDATNRNINEAKIG